MAKKEKVYGTHLKVSTKRAGHKIGGTVGIFVFLLVLALFMAAAIIFCSGHVAENRAGTVRVPAETVCH